MTIEEQVAALLAHAKRTEESLDRLMKLARITHASIKGLENIATAHETRLDEIDLRLDDLDGPK
jgi:hypothetical protein